MSIKVKWGNPEQTFVLLTVENPFSPAELLSTVDEAQALLESIEHQVSTIIDFTLIETVPRGLVSMYPSLATKIGHPRSTGFVVFASKRYRWMADIFSCQFRPLHFADTLDEAEVMVSQFHAQLDNGEKV